jgi:hypothetical protein
MTEYGEILVGGVDGYDILFAEMACVLVVVPVITEGDTSLLATVGAMSGIGDGDLFSSDDRR